MEQKKSTLKEIKATVMPQTAEGLQMLMEETGLTVGEVIDRLTLQMCVLMTWGSQFVLHKIRFFSVFQTCRRKNRKKP